MQAHACLTDKARRRAFDAERSRSFCAACHDRHTSSLPSAAGVRKAAAAAPRGKPRTAAAAQALRDVQNRMRDECRVIDGCLRANNARRRQSFPLFDPSDACRFPDYPHVRPPPSFGDDGRWRFQDQLGRVDPGWGRGGGESPVYQIRTAAPECTERTTRPRAW